MFELYAILPCKINQLQMTYIVIQYNECIRTENLQWNEILFWKCAEKLFEY